MSSKEVRIPSKKITDYFRGVINVATVLWQYTLIANIPTTRCVGHANGCTSSGRITITISVAFGLIGYFNFITPYNRPV